MTLGRVAGKQHSILSAARARTPPESIRYFAFSVEFLETSKSRPARLLATFRMRATEKRSKYE
jgi:hypothetical protein